MLARLLPSARGRSPGAPGSVFPGLLPEGFSHPLACSRPGWWSGSSVWPLPPPVGSCVLAFSPPSAALESQGCRQVAPVSPFMCQGWSRRSLYSKNVIGVELTRCCPGSRCTARDPVTRAHRCLLCPSGITEYDSISPGWVLGPCHPLVLRVLRVLVPSPRFPFRSQKCGLRIFLEVHRSSCFSDSPSERGHAVVSFAPRGVRVSGYIGVAANGISRSFCGWMAMPSHLDPLPSLGVRCAAGSGCGQECCCEQGARRLFRVLRSPGGCGQASCAPSSETRLHCCSETPWLCTGVPAVHLTRPRKAHASRF